VASCNVVQAGGFPSESSVRHAHPLFCGVGQSETSPKLPGRRVPGDARGVCPHELLWDSVWFEYVDLSRRANACLHGKDWGSCLYRNSLRDSSSSRISVETWQYIQLQFDASIERSSPSLPSTSRSRVIIRHHFFRQVPGKRGFE
jgi:hypothetical protein